ncbi:DNA polymerase III subunit chi [Qingshengfaniella alkalisoli]|uniref:DNA polymerase III subunit chi n=1 Tax=Qingshengfaniella alkalisoli TaxID=2599296 RepID=A0A5B8ITE4_9RHOB|nr:DNA polymerase III subunit chi [Qingshengfaniella alkalisoli]QDY68713.1 DNA polymerase III subunit chi [Qingshengfaniella alkalisoli]
MNDVLFYHLTETPLEATLPILLRKSLDAGWRVEIRGGSVERLDWLDQKLWLTGDADFLPHGLAGGAHDALQPILLTTADAVSPATDCLMVVDGAGFDPAEMSGLKRACVMFDGSDDDAVQKARGQWKSVTDAGLTAQYWAQDGGRWIKKTESRPS